MSTFARKYPYEMQYSPQLIEPKWQKYWLKNQTFKTENQSEKPKYYVLDMFPYPSGAGLHVGHPLGYIASDIYARYKRHQGFNVLHPMGYDSFGLPAEQYAIETGQHPATTTRENTDKYRTQLDQIGFSFDWSRQVSTSDPSYYKWTQWIFTELFNSWYDLKADKARPVAELVSHFEKEGTQNLQAACEDDSKEFSAHDWRHFSEKKKQEILLEYRLAFLSETDVNWCPALGTVLANDEIINGVSERGGHPVEKKKMTQWSMRITAYAERLLSGLDRLDWNEPLKEMQRHWIGKSLGAEISFKVKGRSEQIKVFTTRADTLFGVTFITLAPESELASRLITKDYQKAAQTYIEETAKRSDIERMAENRRPSGVFTGSYALHPLTGKDIPIWIGDYVLAGYGTGAVMAVPAGDQRDYEFAAHFQLPIINIFEGIDISEQAFCEKGGFQLTNSEEFNGLGYKQATREIIRALEAKKCGKSKINYRLRDAIFSRQRYWGEPFPVYYKNDMPQIIDLKYLPLTLPDINQYLPTSAKPPLGNATRWAWDEKNNQVTDNRLIDNKTIFPLELNTMPGWAGSSWYFNRYMDPHNPDEFVSNQAVTYWKQVDLYIGGNEHATGHLLYSRFWQKFLFDRGFLPVDEYCVKLINQGMILGESAFIYKEKNQDVYYSKNQAIEKDLLSVRINVKAVDASNCLDTEALKIISPAYKTARFITEPDGSFIVWREVEKMSKSKYNVVNPDDICAEYGADTLRMYEMFLGPIEQSKPWNTAGISGVHNFLKKCWRLYFNETGLCVEDTPPTAENLKTLHKTTRKVASDIESFSFNTAVSAFMICVNELTSQKCHNSAILKDLAVLLSPFAPHFAEELWEQLGYKGGISGVGFPVCNPAYLEEDTKEYPVSFNGKVRFKAIYPTGASASHIEQDILKNSKTTECLQGKKPIKIIVVANKIINVVF